MTVRDRLNSLKNRLAAMTYRPPSISWMEERVESTEAGKDYHHLGMIQINKIIRIILAEARKSSAFGFIMRDEDVLKEAIFYLSVINLRGGIDKFKDNFSFESASAYLSFAVNEVLKEEIAYYQELGASQQRVGNEIICHLESVRARILHNLYNDRLGFNRQESLI
ncbi:MAG: hypothetical protein WCO55_04605 [Candidatus Falkowbacteria bacterium]